MIALCKLVVVLFVYLEFTIGVILVFHFDRDLQKATSDFSMMIGKGSFGSVYKAQMPTGVTVAVKVLDSDSRQGEVEFLTEVNKLFMYQKLGF